ncbi:TetR/AcrR family transcriptional regulator [Deinococcus aestuarii]|uniref:TetR/AcrR family transcriptional regulator n=1 Tax=Deinococcus aestuarii TaxID=2774531 RepID=UPI001C0B3536|nr:TetR/AcrR family transcriptional regulator [Deinococcus aestuarii]
MTESKTRARYRRGEGSRLRQDIVRAAADLLDRGGEGAVTLKEVARRVGIASPSIYAHFPDREAIVAAVVAGTFGELRAELETALERAGPDPVVRLRALCGAYLTFSQDWPQRYRILFGGLWQARSTDLAPGVEEASGIGQDVFVLLSGVLRECQQAGRSTGTDPFADAVGLWAALHGLAQLRLAAPSFPWPDGVLERMVDRLAGLTPAG